MRKSVKKVLMAILALQLLYAQEQMGGYEDQQQEEESQYVVGRDIPYTQAPVRNFIKRYRFEIDADKFYYLYDYIRKKMDNRKRILQGDYDISVLMKPSKRLFKSIDHIFLTTNYITQIIMPKETKITDAVASFPTTLFDFSENELRLRPKKGFVSGNIILHLTDGAKNYTVNLLAENYLQKRCEYIKGVLYCENIKRKELPPKYTYANESVSLIYKYQKTHPLSDIEAIHLYKTLYKKDLNIRKDGDFVAFDYKGVTYFIYRNDKFGNVFYKGKRYIVRK